MPTRDYVETPRHLIVELGADGADYLVRTDAAGTPSCSPGPRCSTSWPTRPTGSPSSKSSNAGPASKTRRERSTLSRWLKRAARQGVVCRSGVGYRGDPLPLLAPWPRGSALARRLRQRRGKASLARTAARNIIAACASSRRPCDELPALAGAAPRRGP